MLKEMTFEIFYDDYSNEERKIVQKKIGISSGISFQDACNKLALKNQNFAKGLNLENLTYKNRELYGNLLN